MVAYGNGWGNLGSPGIGGWGRGHWGGNNIPVASNVKITAAPSFSGTSVPHRSVISVSYDYSDSENDSEIVATIFGVNVGETDSSVETPFQNTDISPNKGTQVRWFLNGNHIQQWDNKLSLGPLSPTELGLDIVGSSLQFALRVSDGSSFSGINYSQLIVLTGSLPIVVNHNVDGIANNQLCAGSEFTVNGLEVTDRYKSSSSFDDNTPGFYWQFQDPDNAPPYLGAIDALGNILPTDHQTHFEIRVGSSSSNLGTDLFTGDLWDSGEVASTDNRTRYGYKGTTRDDTASDLVRDGSTKYYWQVRVSEGDKDADNDLVFSEWVSGNFKMNRMPSVSSLKAEGLSGVQVIDTRTPTLSWTYSDPDGAPQQKIEIRVSNDSPFWGEDDFDGDLLSTGKIVRAGSEYTYNGDQPYSHERIFWQTRVYDGSNFSNWAVAEFSISIPPVAQNLLVNGLFNPGRLVPTAAERSNDIFIPTFSWSFTDSDLNRSTDLSDNQLDFIITVSTDDNFGSVIWTFDSSTYALSDIGNQTFIQYDFDGTASEVFDANDRGITFYWKLVVQDDSEVSGYDTSEETSGTFRWNQIPITLAQNITPSTVYPRSVLFSDYVFFDSDGDPEVISKTAVHLRWLRQKSNELQFTYQSSFDNSKFVPLPADLAKVLKPKLSQGDQWKYEIVPFDGYEFGEKSESGIITVDNHLPIASNLFISPAEPKTLDVLTANYTYFDEDGDPEGDSIIKWFKDDEEVTELQGVRIVYPNMLTTGSEWYFTVTPSDGFGFGSEVVSDKVTIEALVPVVSSFTINGVVNPINVVNLNPTFRWTYYDLSGIGQTGFRIKIGTKIDTSNIFDSGFIESTKTEYSYEGQPLNLGEKFFVTLNVYNNEGPSNPFSATFITYGSIWGERVDNEIGWTISARMKFIPLETSDISSASVTPPTPPKHPMDELGGLSAPVPSA